MTASEIATALHNHGLITTKVRLGDTEGYYWASITTTEYNDQTHTYSVRLDLDCTAHDIEVAAATLKAQLQYPEMLAGIQDQAQNQADLPF